MTELTLQTKPQRARTEIHEHAHKVLEQVERHRSREGAPPANPHAICHGVAGNAGADVEDAKGHVRQDEHAEFHDDQRYLSPITVDTCDDCDNEANAAE